eukprot:6295075-Amphidinium_carterae.1
MAPSMAPADTEYHTPTQPQSHLLDEHTVNNDRRRLRSIYPIWERSVVQEHEGFTASSCIESHHTASQGPSSPATSAA